MGTIDHAIAGYADALSKLTQLTDTEAIERAIEALRDCYNRGGSIFVFGNGGSAATSNHLAADFEKNAAKPGHPKPKVISLASDSAKILAYGNDIEFAEVFSNQLRSLASAGDIAIAISASGNSPNIIRAIDAARMIGVQSIGLSGFSGGQLRKSCDISIHYDVNSYELVEDLHSMVCHIFVSCFQGK